MKSILIADDHDIVRSGVAQALRSGMGEIRIGLCADAKSLLGMADDGKWDLFVVDIFLPHRGGLELLPDLRQLGPDTPVLIITGLSDSADAIKSYRLGARGFIHKSRLLEDLVPAAIKALAGGTWLSDDTAPPNGRKDEGPRYEWAV